MACYLPPISLAVPLHGLGCTTRETVTVFSHNKQSLKLPCKYSEQYSQINQNPSWPTMYRVVVTETVVHKNYSFNLENTSCQAPYHCNPKSFYTIEGP